MSVINMPDMTTVIPKQSAPVGALGALAMGATGVGALLNAGVGVANYFQQKKTYKEQMALQREAWAREDNSVQRRVADMKAAGINPVLAAGQSASSSSPIKLNAPQMSNVGSDVASIGNVLGLMQQKKNIDMADHELKILQFQRDMKYTDNNVYPYLKDEELKQARLATQQMSIDALQKAENYRILKDMGYTGKFIGILKDILGPVSPLLYGKRR